jgi:hypothetical protein
MPCRTCRAIHAFQRTIGKVMPSHGNTMKAHRLSHLSSVLEFFGQLKAISSQPFEHNHNAYKPLYGHTTRRTRSGESYAQLAERVVAWRIADSLQTAQQAADRAAAAESQDGCAGVLTAHARVVQSGLPALVKDGEVVHDYRDIADPDRLSSKSMAAKMVAVQPLTRCLPSALMEYLDLRREEEVVITKITIVKTALISAPVCH